MSRFLPLLSLVALALWSPVQVLTADVNYQFNIVNADISSDGFKRNAVLVNNLFPGTLIQANKNDVLHINVSNQLTNPQMRRSTSIHWHGLFQHRTASEDGPAMVTQCPIAPGHSYTYDIPLNGQSGTFWYHSHLSSQYVDGLRGALVVYDDEDPNRSLYDIDDASTVVTLADWYHDFAPALEEKYFSPRNGGGHEPVPDSGVINGLGRFKKGPTVPWAVINVAQGLRYRLRVINVSGFAQFRFSIDSHRMTIIEADGIPHEPLTVDAFDIYAGQRYSVVINANQPINNYWIRAPLEVQGESDNKNLDADNIFAILRYANASISDPTTKAKRKNGGDDGSGSSGSGKGGGKGGGGDGGDGGDDGGDDSGHGGGGGGGVLLREQNLRAIGLPVPGGSGPADRTIDLDFTQSKDDQGGVEWTINGIKYLPPDLPTLLNIMANNFTLESDFTKSEHTFVLNRNDVIDLVIHGSSHGIIHPFHLHGHAFHVIESNDGGGPNYVNPPVRDVIGVGGGRVRIRFRADNPGPWFLHCHIDWHLEAGLAVVFAEAPQEQRTGPDSQIIKDTWVDLCKIYKNLPADQQ
ncbi:multicopper oxidase [Sphaerobolus stellatus SS14]|uniref:Unplaced genomic scaffold SPHSTscaffold_101, whole genome shotgun sequence n=1 Tax=Sphaerobolus stellatus (strain SS14) TaxID=990650 RepID=A0A0C9UPF7_SPHS4|nr:multicopper oxidase [Sphaerobolus stellatus SS14]